MSPVSPYPSVVDTDADSYRWDTGTVCIKSHIRVEPVAESSFNFKEAKLVLSTLEANQKVPGADATMEEDGTISWTVDEHIRLPTCKFDSRLKPS